MRAIAGIIAAATLASGCQIQGLAFREDERVRIVSPGYREQVRSPVIIDWELTDLQLASTFSSSQSAAAQFGVFRDVDPQPPGESLAYFARNDPACRRAEGCPDRSYLEGRGVYLTRDTQVTFDVLPPAPGVDLERGDRDVHDVTVVLLSADGRRVGESAWTITFEVIREED